MEFLGKKIKAIILDMDGTLIDSTGIWAQIDIDFFAKRGYKSVPEEFTKTIVCTGLNEGAKLTKEKYGLPTDTVESIIKEWFDSSIDQYANKVPLKAYAKEYLEYLSKQDVHICLATANEKSLYEPCLKRLGIKQYFEIITDPSQHKEGKTSSKIFDYLIEKVGVKREETIVIDDSLIALTAAHDAGYLTIGVHDQGSIKLEKEKMYISDLYIHSFKELL